MRIRRISVGFPHFLDELPRKKIGRDIIFFCGQTVKLDTPFGSLDFSRHTIFHCLFRVFWVTNSHAWHYNLSFNGVRLIHPNHWKIEKKKKKKKNENCTLLIPKGNSYCRRKSSARGPRFKVSFEDDSPIRKSMNQNIQQLTLFTYPKIHCSLNSK